MLILEKKIRKQPDTIKILFRKLSNNLDGTEDDQTKISGTKVFAMPSMESWSDSKFTEVDTDYSNDLTESEFEPESGKMHKYL